MFALGGCVQQQVAAPVLPPLPEEPDNLVAPVAVGILDLLDHDNTQINRMTYQLIRILREVADEDDEIPWLRLRAYIERVIRNHPDAERALGILSTAAATLTMRVRDQLNERDLGFSDTVRVGDLLDSAEWILTVRQPIPEEIIIDESDRDYAEE